MANKLKTPIPEKPYFPGAGWNPDAQGLSLKVDECADTLNLRYSKKEVFTRAGSRRLTYNSLGTNPALALVDFKRPNMVDTTFAFTKNCIFKNTVQDWSYAVAYSEKDTCQATANWEAGLTVSPTLSTRHQFGTGSIALLNLQATEMGDQVVLISKKSVSWNFSARTHIGFWYMNTSPVDINVTVRFYSGADYTTEIEHFDLTLVANTTTAFKDLYMKMTTPASFSNVQSFKMMFNGAQTTGALWSFYIDSIVGIDILPYDVEYWSTCRFVDSTAGETLVAAGSNPPLFDEAEDDGASRLLYYYDNTNSWFSALTTYRNVSLGDEDTTVNGPAGAGTAVSTAALAGAAVSGFQSIVAGTFSIYTIEHGTLATASAITSTIGTKSGYYLVPTDASKIKGGANSWVYADGSAWSCEFLTADYSGLDLYVLYDYKVTNTYKPRFVWSFHNRLLFGNLYEGTAYQPWRVRATEVEDMDLMEDTNYWDLVDNDTSPITAGDHLGYYLTIYKGDSIVKGSYIGGTSIFTFATVWKAGTYAGRTLQAYKGRHYLLGKDDVYSWDGNTLDSISFDPSNGQFRTQATIMQNLNMNKLNHCFGIVVPQNQEYWLWIVDSSGTYPSRVYVYSILLGIWYYHEFSETICAGHFHVESGATWDDLIGDWDEQNWTWDEVGLEGTTKSVLLGWAAGQVDVMDNKLATDEGYWDADTTWVPGTAISTRLITRDFIFNNLQLFDRVERLSFEAFGTTCQVGYDWIYNINPATFLQIEDVTLSQAFDERFYFPDANTKKIRFLFTSSNYFSLRWAQPFAVATETFNE